MAAMDWIARVLGLGIALEGALAACALAQTPAQTPSTAAAAQADEARARFDRLCAASGPEAREPVTAFVLQAEVLTRSGVQTNEARIEYRYLAPDCIRFMLPSRSETGRFGLAQEQYWLKSGKDVVVLAGREYKEDRQQVDEMAALARNYLALSDPRRVNLVSLELLAVPPRDLPEELARTGKKLVWLALESPDFALVRREGTPPPPGTLYRVELGLGEDDLPRMAIVRARAGVNDAPLLVVLDSYRAASGFRVPYHLAVHVLEAGRKPAVFAPRASQDITVTQADLRPALRVDDFRP